MEDNIRFLTREIHAEIHTNMRKGMIFKDMKMNIGEQLKRNNNATVSEYFLLTRHSFKSLCILISQNLTGIF